MIDQNDSLKLWGQRLRILWQLVDGEKIFMPARHFGVVQGYFILRSQVECICRCLEQCDGFDWRRRVLGDMFEVVSPGQRRSHGIQIAALVSLHQNPFRLFARLPVNQELLLGCATPLAEMANSFLIRDHLLGRVKHCLVLKVSRHGGDQSCSKHGREQRVRSHVAMTS